MTGLEATQACEGPEACWLGPRGGACHPDGGLCAQLPWSYHSVVTLQPYSTCQCMFYFVTPHYTSLSDVSWLLMIVYFSL